MADKDDEDKKGLKGKNILRSHITKVTAIVAAIPNDFFTKLAEKDLVTTESFDPDQKMSKREQVTKLYTECMTVVRYDPSKFSELMDVLSEYPTLNKTVEKMKKEGKKAGLMDEADVSSTSEEDKNDDVKSKEVKKKRMKRKRTEGSSSRPSKQKRKDSANDRKQSKGAHKKPSSAYDDSDDSSSGEDEPDDKDLEKFVAMEVSSSEPLGIFLGLSTVQIAMIKEEKLSPIRTNMRILATWKQKQTKKPISWGTLIAALRDMEMNRLAGKLEKKFGAK